MFCFPNTRQEILFPSNSALFTCISAHNQLRRKEKVSGSTRTSIGKTKHLGPRPAPPHPLRPVNTYPFFVWKRNFFFRFGLLSTRIRWNASFQNALQSGDFKNAGFSFTCGQTNTMMPHNLTLPAWSMLSKGFCFNVFVWTGESDSDTLGVDVYFLKMEKMKKSLAVFKNTKNIRIRVDWALGYVQTNPHTYYFTWIGPQFTRNQWTSFILPCQS